jgi:hypothetical protein
MQKSFAEGDLVAGARITQWNVVRLIRIKHGYRLSRNHLEELGMFEKLERALDAFERATHGALAP